ncbi:MULTISPECIES: gamma-glutamyltransferase [unclassified Yoonia]|uniref:gamma-glutamyltransferase n=1 Tax=unclassified Yoonia TaxID=2629118 RepID=UPI002AFFB7FA|nr:MULTISPECIES: gamma-glutamyltransferase [unclassified Yoonia]
MYRSTSTAILAWLLASQAMAQQASDVIVPEPATEVAQEFPGISDAAAAALAAKGDGLPVEATDWMITAANPLAVDAGARVLREGGNAADAMVAVQAVLGLVEPQSSGLGGGAFLVWYDAESGEITTLDARETAPLAADPRYFQDADGAPLDFMTAVVSGRSVGTPGTPKLMEEAHRRWGRSNWQGLFDDAISHAEDGFAVSTRMADSVAAAADSLTTFPATADYFLPDGAPVAAGATLTNPAYAETLRQIATQGTQAFYTGEIAADIVAATRTADNPGLLSMTDLARYQVIERPAVCYDYRGAEVCGMGPPSSGAVAVAQILGMLENFDIGAMGPQDVEARRLMGDATRLAFADRGRYLADSDFVPVPLQGLIDRDYLASRADLLRGDDALPEVSAGTPEWDHAMIWGDDLREERPATSHISIVDADGNVLSMTTTIEGGFGSRIFVRGFLLNNELTDFSFATHADGWPIANRVEPGKRPRSSMSPTIVLRDGSPVLAIGSPGGATIIGFTAQAIIAYLDWGMNVQEAVSMPHLINSFGTYQIEAGTWAEDLTAPLTDLGFETNVTAMTSGLQAISIGDGLRGGADPRREGIALGD